MGTFRARYVPKNGTSVLINYPYLATIYQKTLRNWLKTSFDFTHFVTLTSHQDLSAPTMRDRLREWDARLNRKLYGPKWQQHQDDLLWYFAFLEKPVVNPHWHLLMRVDGRWEADRADEYRRLLPTVASAWSQIMPSGTTDVQEIDRRTYSTVEDYVVKELRGALQYEMFVTPDEFRSR